jgi:hypothetical protein
MSINSAKIWPPLRRLSPMPPRLLVLQPVNLPARRGGHWAIGGEVNFDRRWQLCVKRPNGEVLAWWPTDEGWQNKLGTFEWVCRIDLADLMPFQILIV